MNKTTMENEYGKEAILEILMRRDGMFRDDAMRLINDVQETIDDYLAHHGSDWDDIADVIREDLGLEPDYMDCFLGF